MIKEVIGIHLTFITLLVVDTSHEWPDSNLMIKESVSHAISIQTNGACRGFVGS
jgi:hypothetical protein